MWNSNRRIEKTMAFYKVVWTYGDYQLVERPDTPCYYVYYRVPGRPTIRRSSGETDFHTAQRWLIDYAQRRQRPTKPHPSEVDLVPVLHTYVNTQLSGKSQTDGEWSVKRLAQFLDRAAISTVEEMTPGMQREFIAWRQATAPSRKRLSNGTINKDLQVLRAALRFWKHEGFVSEIPHVRLLPQPPPRERFLTQEEAGRLLDECHEPHLRLFVLLALHTLQRPGAILQLRCNQVDLDRRRIDFRIAGQAQTNKRRTVVPITDSLLPVLHDAVHNSRSGYVIEHHGQPVARIDKGFRNACRRANLKGASPVTLRHTGATLLVNAGVPLWEVSGLLAHGSMTTSQIYAKHVPDYLSQATAGIDHLFGDLATRRARGAPELTTHPRLLTHEKG
jgi:integrase